MIHFIIFLLLFTSRSNGLRWNDQHDAECPVIHSHEERLCENTLNLVISNSRRSRGEKSYITNKQIVVEDFSLRSK
jgi:hypothetical protein